jgi:hypothetical protein
MPLGSGILPAGALGTQLSYITRRAVLQRAIVQIYNTCPLLVGLLSNAMLEAGGIDSVIANVQYQQLVQPQYTGFDGTFTSPTGMVGLTPASWSLCMALCPIPVLATELLIQEKQKIQSILDLRFNDAGNAMRDMLGNTLYNNTTNLLQPIGLPGAIDDGTNLVTYGGINRSTNTWWQAKRYAAGSVNPTRALMAQYINGVVKAQGEAPDAFFMNAGTWTLLMQDYLGLERYQPNQLRTSEYLSGFRALEVMGVPVFIDPYCPEGTAYGCNFNYLTLRIHEDAEWEFFDFVANLPANSLSFTGVIMLLLALINTKPKTNVVITGFNSVTI